MSNVIVFGLTGQVAQSLRDTQSSELAVTYANRVACDLSEPLSVESYLEQESPDLIINAAAYTQVDKAEEEPELAERINADAVGVMARFAEENQAKLIHISTDFVFDGKKTSPYLPGDETGPLGEYGASKLGGELQALSAAPEKTMIIRTAWVYSEHGSNFVKTMLRLMKERDELGVVSDQRGSPTYARSLAEVVWQIVERDLFRPGIYHWTDDGDITWHDFALGIQNEGIEAGLLEQQIPVKAIATDDYPTPAARPAYSVLNTDKLATLSGCHPQPWQSNLSVALSRFAK
ncbi:MAG: dTDP-4-dehydrorhamnose reductase [Pseudomonadales bacterium]|nr:dTDP-4-dehydrorhamnose reductase [Pseudomonadales bacterium]MBO6595992.1 dTDP-4-dehydrorhamnose reductase [Pseudomonadales bacterium]MBO6822475.1 dTDP-4-dehydrorhamnose reductase [Pseudomonadales bacterium]